MKQNICLNYTVMTCLFSCQSIPERFAKNFNRTGSIDLKAPSGETWNIGVDKHVDELCLVSRWEDFVKAHRLRENDLLVFTCSGNFSFDVMIFEASGYEKVSSLLGNSTGTDMRKRFDDMADRGKPGKQAEHYALTHSEDTTTIPSHLAGFPHHACTSKKSGSRNSSK